MTPETLSELKSLLEKATPEKWDANKFVAFGAKDYSTKEEQEINNNLACALRNNATDLIKAVEQRDRYRAALEEVKNFQDSLPFCDDSECGCAQIPYHDKYQAIVNEALNGPKETR